jgi:hypothetical protein
MPLMARRASKQVWLQPFGGVALAVCCLLSTPAHAVESASGQEGLTQQAIADGPKLLGGPLKAWSPKDLRGKWTWLYFGFAHCPDICPVALADLANVYQRLKHPERVQMVFVSVDTKQDTPESLADYTRYFNPNFWGVTGTPAHLKALADSVGANFAVQPATDPKEPDIIGHPNRVFIIDPEGVSVGSYVLEPATSLDTLVRDFNSAQVSLDNLDTGPLSTSEAWCGLPESGASGQQVLMHRARAMGSGTSLQAAESPMRMYGAPIGDGLLMLHHNLFAGLVRPGVGQIGPSVVAENWAMAMFSQRLGNGIWDARMMLSLEPFTVSPAGTPQAFQSGETYLGRPLVDRQHPHDLLMELASRYTAHFGDRLSAYLYGGLVGEPALGPNSFMHRASAADNPWTPLGHHMQDSTHLSTGVATAGLRFADFQLEASAFNGREPDENRLNLDFGPLDSTSARLWWIPGRNWSLQVSQGLLKDKGSEILRRSASVSHTVFMQNVQWSSSAIWGQNLEAHHTEPEQAWLLESQVDWLAQHHWYGRAERVHRAGLFANDHQIAQVDALTLGYSYDLPWVKLASLGVGGDVTIGWPDAALRQRYDDSTVAWRIHMRLRPPTMTHSNRLQ